MIKTFSIPILVSAKSIMDFHLLDNSLIDNLKINLIQSNIFKQDVQVHILPKLYDLNDLDSLKNIDPNYLVVNSINFNSYDQKINPKFSVKNDSQFWPNENACMQIKFLVFVVAYHYPLSIDNHIDEKMNFALSNISQDIIHFFKNIYDIHTVTALIPEPLENSKAVGNNIFHEFCFTTALKGYLNYYKLDYSDIYLLIFPFQNYMRVYVVFKDMPLFFYQRDFVDNDNYDSVVNAMYQLFKFLNIQNVQISNSLDISEQQVMALVSIGDDNVKH